jgi:hypothetical protein
MDGLGSATHGFPAAHSNVAANGLWLATTQHGAGRSVLSLPGMSQFGEIGFELETIPDRRTMRDRSELHLLARLEGNASLSDQVQR